MKTKIYKVVLWSNAPDRGPSRHEVSLLPKGAQAVDLPNMTVLFGANGTGKSTLIQIIQLCFGSTQASMPLERPYQETLAAMGVVLGFGTRVYLMGRFCSFGQAGDNFWIQLERDDDELPGLSDISLLANQEGFDSWLGGQMGTEGIIAAGDEGWQGDVRDDSPARVERAETIQVLPSTVLPLCVLTADYLSSSDSIFRHVFRDELPLLRSVLSIAFDIDSPAILSDRVRLRVLRSKLAGIKRQVAREKDLLRGVIQSANSVYQELMEIGLLESGRVAPTPGQLTLFAQEPDDPKVLLDRLESLLSLRRRLDRLEATSSLAEQIRRIRQDEKRLLDELSILQHRQMDLNSALSGPEELLSVSEQIRPRLRAFHWCQQHLTGEHICPVCGSESDLARIELENIRQAIDSHNAHANSAGWFLDELRLDAERIRNEIADRKRVLEGVRADMKIVSDELEMGMKAIGRLSLRKIEKGLALSELVTRTLPVLREHLKNRENEAQMAESADQIQARIGEADFMEAQGRIEQGIADLVQEIAQRLDLSHSYEYTPEISLDRLTFKLRRPLTRSSVAIGRLGGAKNWMGYKLSFHLAVHTLAARRFSGPIPSLLIIDHFSAVDAGGGEMSRSLTSRVYRELIRFSRETGVQVVVLGGLTDEGHLADEMKEQVHIIRWEEDGGVGLIPHGWIRR